MAERLQARLLSKKEVGTIYEKCLKILADKGVEVDHEEGMKQLAKKGAQVDTNNRIVRFPRNIVESALKTVPHSITLTGNKVIPSTNGVFYVNCETGANSYIDPETNSRKNMTIDFVREWAQLLESLEEITITAYESPTDVPEKTADIHALKTLLENTSKHIMVHPYSYESLQYLFELGLVVAGSTEAYKKQPRFNMICCSVAPLKFKAMDYEAIRLCCQYGQPVLSASLTTAGATAPVTIAGQVLLSGVEILAMLVMSQLINPGTPFIGNPFAFALNMSTGRNLMSTAEACLSEAAICQFVKEAFNVPVGQNGFGTDSHLTDGQASFEEAIMGMLGAISVGCDFLIGAGAISTILCVSPLKLISDASVTRILNRIRAGIKVNDDTLAWQEIFNVKPGGNFLENPHTLKHCRDAVRVDLISDLTLDAWQAEGSKGLYERALDHYRELKKGFKPLALPKEVKNELDKIVKKADEKLAK